MENKLTLYTVFIKEIEKGRDTATHKWLEGGYSDIYRNLFSMLSEEELSRTLKWVYTLSRGDDDYFKDSGVEDWFRIFHKSIRQGDFYSKVFIERKLVILSDEEEAEIKFLRHEFREGNIEKRSDVEGELWTKEYDRFRELVNEKQHEEKDFSLSGNMDSILWNMIQVDNEFLYNTMDMTFAKWDVINKITA